MTKIVFMASPLPLDFPLDCGRDPAPAALAPRQSYRTGKESGKMIAEADDATVLGILALLGLATAAASSRLRQDGDVARPLHSLGSHADRLGRRTLRRRRRTSPALVTR